MLTNQCYTAHNVLCTQIFTTHIINQVNYLVQVYNMSQCSVHYSQVQQQEESTKHLM